MEESTVEQKLEGLKDDLRYLLIYFGDQDKTNKDPKAKNSEEFEAAYDHLRKAWNETIQIKEQVNEVRP